MDKETVLLGRSQAVYRLFIWIALIGVSLSIELIADPMKESKLQAKEFVRNQGSPWTLSKSENVDFLRPLDRGDVECLRSAVIENERPDNEVQDFFDNGGVLCNVTQIDPEESYIQRSEHLEGQEGSGDSLLEDTAQYHRCYKSGAPRVVDVLRDLDVEVQVSPAKIQTQLVCRGHKKKKKYYWKDDAQAYRRRQIEVYSHDPHIDWFEVKISGGGGLTDYKVTTSFRHVNNYDSCSSCDEGDILIEEGSVTEVDSWIYSSKSNESYLNSPNANLVNRRCEITGGFRLINGIEVYRECWKEKLTFLVTPEEVDTCKSLWQRNCELVESRCVEDGDYGCLKWEKLFRCVGIFNEGTYSISLADEISYEDEEGRGASLAEVSSKLAVFSEVQKEMDANGFDGTELRIFKGQTSRCEKSFLENALYDCCLSLSGLATDVHLARCTGDELALSEKRQRGLCHYVGSKAKKTVAGIQIGTKHVFCCYSSKLARVFQEEARKLLGISWGSASKPNCRGLTQEEFTSLDFSRMDFSEVYEDLLRDAPTDTDERLDHFQVDIQKLKERMLRDLGGE